MNYFLKKKKPLAEKLTRFRICPSKVPLRAQRVGAGEPFFLGGNLFPAKGGNA
jgi:hypothetical protein